MRYDALMPQAVTHVDHTACRRFITLDVPRAPSDDVDSVTLRLNQADGIGRQEITLTPGDYLQLVNCLVKTVKGD